MNGTIRINSEPPKSTTFEYLGYVQVVRCKDCKYNDDGECIIKAGWFPVKPDWYCADGEQQEVPDKIDWKKELVDDFKKHLQEDYKRSVCPEIEGDRHTWFYICGDCHGQVNWHDAVCRHCKVRLDWNG